jgi:hypothetical protein
MTELERNLQKRIDEVLVVLDQMHHDPQFCKGDLVGECQESDCWIWKLQKMLRSP